MGLAADIEPSAWFWDSPPKSGAEQCAVSRWPCWSDTLCSQGSFLFFCFLVLVLFVTLSKQPWALFSPLPGHLLEASGNQVQAPTSRAFMLKFAATLPPTLAFVILPRCTSLCTRYERGLNSTISLLKLWWARVTLSPLNIDMYQSAPIFLC